MRNPVAIPPRGVIWARLSEGECAHSYNQTHCIDSATILASAFVVIDRDKAPKGSQYSVIVGVVYTMFALTVVVIFARRLRKSAVATARSINDMLDQL